MEKSPSSLEFGGSRELQCVGKMEIVRPKPAGFLCGSIPVVTDNSLHAFKSALVPSRETVSAPRYQMIPTETDLTRLPPIRNLPEKVLPAGAVQCKTTGDVTWEGDAITTNLRRKGEALAVSGLVDYGDEIDVIAPTDILKQIFKIPYSKARLSLAVHRVGQTLVLNSGPEVEEGEKLVRRHNSPSKCTEQSLFVNFAMHSTRVEACDCPPTHQPRSEPQPCSPVLPGEETPHYVERSDNIASKEGFSQDSKYPPVKQDDFFWGSKKRNRNKGRDPVKKAAHVGEKARSSMQESERHSRVGNNGFLRVLFWQFHNFRMLLGSDLLLFSNEKYAAVSLHLWDVTRQVTPLTWLDAWLDNVMASVPELAICYHQNGVVQGYELLKTDEIFLLKGISEDGTPAFHPHVVQQNGLTVLRFLQENCKRDPGAYWLYKNAGDDVVQLFDLSVIPKNHSSSDCDDSSSSLPPLSHGGRHDSLFSLGTLLYRIAHRLSLSMVTKNRAKCARFFRKCLDLLDEPDHLVVRAFAHEQFARLILKNDGELDFASEFLPIECDVTVTEPEDSLDPITSFSESVIHENTTLAVENKQIEDGISIEELAIEESVLTMKSNISAPGKFAASRDIGPADEVRVPQIVSSEENLAFSETSCKQVVQTLTDPISSKLAAVHHVSQAIKSLRWMRELQSSESDLVGQGIGNHDQLPSSVNHFVCSCGDADCIEVCDIREWLPTSKLDNKLWKLVLLLGESYLALGQAYKEDSQLHQALKIVELACSVYGSMPKQLEDTRFISSIVNTSPQTKFNDRIEKKESFIDECFTLEQFSSAHLFWAKAWTLVGDVYVEFHKIMGKGILVPTGKKPSTSELTMSSAVVKEVQRLKKKLGQYKENCSFCSLVNCSCQSDRASSGSSASSSSGGKDAVTLSRKHGKRSNTKSVSNSPLGKHDGENSKLRDDGNIQNNGDGDTTIKASGAVRHSRLVESDDALNKNSKAEYGGIFKYLKSHVIGDAEHNLSAAFCCYEEAKKALGGVSSGSEELQSVMKRKGWVCNELGRNRLGRKELNKAESAFVDAIHAFREVSDHTNIILINCNLGHGRRALAEEMVTKIEGLKKHAVLHNAYKQALETAKLEYSESLRYYGAAKMELNAITDEEHSVPDNLKNEVYTQFAHTYLRLGMLLARENITAEVYENGTPKIPCDRRNRKEWRKHELSANEAIREALSVYESLGKLRKQEAAYAYYQLACYQRDCCLRFLQADSKKSNTSKGENSVLQRVKQYASLSDRSWAKALDFYGAKTHPSMYLTILVERSALSFTLSSQLHSNTMIESALSYLLEGRHASEALSDSFAKDYPDLHAKFWSQLQTVLKKMLSSALSSNSNKSSSASQSSSASNRSADSTKFRELYKVSLKSTKLSELDAMHTFWTSEVEG